ncbi:hypothetical protein EZS27_011990 [termite gut metagenome]|uniref:Uncharacterized protein n=1 Tax=termite gut metagenome TaxID=433724 RepID=A0A5J4S225_9ZZZZ
MKPKKEFALFRKIRVEIFEFGMPLYIPRTKAYSGGYCLAIVNFGKRPQTLCKAIKDTRIAIRKNGKDIIIIKSGNVDKNSIIFP